MRALGLGIAGALIVGCSPFVPFPDIVAETSRLRCEDGDDNDLDGKTDCADEDCQTLCNRCGEVAERTFDDLGQLCMRDCECFEGLTCNDRARTVEGDELVTTSRCAPRPEPEEDGFDIAFTVEAEGPRDGRQSVQGLVRFDGIETSVESARWILEDSAIDFRGPPEAGQQSTLLVFAFPIPRPAVSTSTSVFIEDPIEVTISDTEGDFGPVPAQGEGSGLSVNQLAVVESSELEFEPLDETPVGFWRGRYRGRLRAAAAFDRWRGCRPGEGSVYDAETGTCRTSNPDELLFYLACAFRPNAERGLGEIAFSWIPWWSDRFERFSFGECVAEQEEDQIRLRAAVDADRTTQVVESWVLELVIPRFRAVSDVGLLVGGEVEARMWRTEAIEGNRTTPLLDFELGPPERLIEGRLRIDEQRTGPDGRFLGWIRGVLVRP